MWHLSLASPDDIGPAGPCVAQTSTPHSQQVHEAHSIN